MRAVVFSGPSLDHKSVRAIIDAECRPPVKQGDVYRVARQSPDAIGVIDGYFQGVPAVWHKEILWAMSQGIPVFGGASMGALRAAELDQFGMQGVGRIYEQFRDGVLEDDDEVALVHGPAELGYKPITLPMVNVRATLTRGVCEGVVSPEMAVTLTDVAKAIFYQDRTWDRILDGRGSSGLVVWLVEHQIDQKREDAREMLMVMQASLGLFPQPVFSFESNIYWERAVGAADLEDSKSEELSELDVLVLDEARLSPKQWSEWCAAALGRFFAAGSLPADQLLAARDLKTIASEFRSARGMGRHADLLSWCEANSLDEEALGRLLQSEESLRQAYRANLSQLYPDVLAHLRSTGCYEALAKRGRAKQMRLNERGWSSPTSRDAGVSLNLLADELIGTSAETPEELAVVLGFDEVADLGHALAREQAYRSTENDEGGSGD